MPKRPASLRALVLCAASLAAAPWMPANASDVTSTGSFSSFSGDVNAVSGPGNGAFQVFVNNQLLLPSAQILGNYYQGTRALGPGTTSVEFKTRQPGLPFNDANLIAFAAASGAAPDDPSTPFLLGTLTLTNGIWFSQASVTLTVRTRSTDVRFDNRSFTDTLRYTVTPNTGTDEQNADYLSFDAHPELGRLRVYEAASGLGNTGSVQLYGRVGSLIPMYFANPTGAVFIQAVPEPESWALLALGLAAITLAARRRQGAAEPRRA